MRTRRTLRFHPPTRKLGIAATAALLVLSGGVARAQDRPNDSGSTEPGVDPIATESVDVERTTLAVDGKTVDAVPPGELVAVTLTIRNNLTEGARNVRVHLEQPPDRVRVTDANAMAGDIAPGDTATATVGIVVDADECTDFVGLGGEITYDGGTSPLKVGIPVACPGPRLSLENVVFSGGDGDGVPEPGETVRAVVVLRNDGRDPATGVRARVTMTGEDVTAQNDHLAWPDIAPRASARSSSPLTLVIGDDAPRQKRCEGVRVVPAPGEAPPVADDTLPPDTAVSSDGTVSSGGATGSGGAGSSEPGSAGGGAPSSTSDTPTVIEPYPGTGSPEPLPATVEPVPEPGTIEPQPEPADQPAVVTLTLAVSAANNETSLAYSNRIFCALEGGSGAAKDLIGAPVAARDDASGTAGGGGASLPVVLALLAAAVAVGGRSLLLR